jgi:predicted aspartyl protease
MFTSVILILLHFNFFPEILRMNKISAAAHGWILRIAGYVVYLCFGLSLVQARAPVNLDIIKRDGYGSVELRQSGINEFVVQGTVNGRAVRLVLDTGAAARNIVLTKSFAAFLRVPPHPVKGIGISLTGKHIEHLTEGTADSLVLGSVQIMNTTVDFAPFEHLTRRNRQGLLRAPDGLSDAEARRTDADGFLGLGFLQRCAAIIDPGNSRLYLKPPGVGRVPQLSPALTAAGFSEASLQLTGLGLLVDVSLNDVPSKMVIDTGAGLSVVDSQYAEQAKLKRYGAAGVRMTDSAGVETAVSWADPASFKIGGVNALRTRLVVRPTSSYQLSGGKVGGLLGLDFIGQSWGIIDFAQHKLYFAATK